MKSIIYPLILPIFLCIILFIVFIKSGNGYFPSDDSYINLQFAKNIYDTGTLSYNAGEWSAGTTDPLYCLFETIVYFFMRNWYVSGIVVGIISFVSCGIIGGMFCYKSFNRNIAVYFLFLFLLSGELIYHSIMGLETIAYCAMILATFYAIYYKQWYVWGFLMGLSYYLRPDIIFLIPVVFIWFIMKKEYRNLLKGFVMAVITVLPLVCFYFYQNGTPFPNTVKATSLLMNDYSMSARWIFLRTCLFFTSGDYVRGNETSVLYALQHYIPFGIIGALVLFTAYRTYFLIPYSYAAVHCLNLFISKPTASDWQRYIIVEWIIVLMSFAVLFYWLFDKIKAEKLSNVLKMLVIVIITILFFEDGIWQSTAYGNTVKYFYIRDIVTGLWISKNTPPNAVIGLYQAGAPKFFSQRYCVDFGGLMQPALWQYEKSKTGLKAIQDYHIDYIATFGDDFLKPYGIQNAYDPRYFIDLPVQCRGLVKVKR